MEMEISRSRQWHIMNQREYWQNPQVTSLFSHESVTDEQRNKLVTDALEFLQSKRIEIVQHMHITMWTKAVLKCYSKESKEQVLAS